MYLALEGETGDNVGDEDLMIMIKRKTATMIIKTIRK